MTKYKYTSEFIHYHNSHTRRPDPANCQACALTDERQEAPNYAAWPLAYMANNKAIPAKWRLAFFKEMTSKNQAYAENIRHHIREYGVKFTDGVVIDATNKEKAEALMQRHGGYWGEHPDYPASDWRHEVADHDTRAGYWEWVANQLEQTND